MHILLIIMLTYYALNLLLSDFNLLPFYRVNPLVKTLSGDDTVVTVSQLHGAICLNCLLMCLMYLSLKSINI